jgi:general secretion pathway protein D
MSLPSPEIKAANRTEPVVALEPNSILTPSDAGAAPNGTAAVRQMRIVAGPATPSIANLKQRDLAAEVKAAAADDVLAAVNLQQVALPTFVQILYSEILKKTVNLHPDVLARQDLVTFRTAGGQTAAQLEQAVRLLLKSYGVSAIDLGGLVRVLPDNANLGDLPSIRYGAAMPDVPLPLRPVFQVVQTQSVRHADVVGWLRMMFGERVRIQEDAGRNSLIISGNPDNVKAALDAIVVLDQPILQGRATIALTPAHWSADELARRLAEVLGAEGYAVQPVGQAITPGGIRFPVILMPVPAVNSVYVFAATDTILNHVTDWAKRLDLPSQRSSGKNFSTYVVKHKDAGLLATTLDRVLSGPRPAPAAPVPGAAAQAAAPSLGAVVIDKSTNTLIFQTPADDQGQIMSLLQSLDRPAKAVLIEVTVAELALDNGSTLGVEWLANQVTSSRSSTVGTLGNLGLGSAGFNYRIFDGAGQLRMALNALASNNRATILSSPRLMARNGEAATIQVGQEVPVITSQQSVTAVGGSGVLQTVQYRSTGVILKVMPVIHSGDQLDLDVSQEVSEAVSTLTGVSASPTFTTRKLDTKLTLRNGATVLLGGLISENGANGSVGIPFLKDLPVVGSLFSNRTGSGNRRELIVLITPYVANDSHDAEAITDAFRKSLGAWASPAKPLAGAAGAEPPLVPDKDRPAQGATPATR